MKANLPPPPKSYRRSHKLLAPVLHRLHMSCDHFSDLTLQSMDRRLTPGEKLRHFLHFIACSVCRKFVKQMRALSQLVKASVAEQEERRPDPGFLTAVRARLHDIAGETEPPGGPNG